MTPPADKLDSANRWRFVEIVYGSETYQQTLKLRDALLRRPLGLRVTEADIQEEASQMHFGLEHQGELIACLVVVALGDQHAKLRQMAVAVDYQRRGIGTQLMQQTETVLRERGFQVVELHARVPAIGFYERLGYRALGERFTEVTIPHQKMIREL